MNKTIQITLAALVLSVAAGSASAQTTNYFSPGQGLVMTAITNGNTTNYFSPGLGLVGTSIGN